MGGNLGNDENRTDAQSKRFVRGSMPTFDNPNELLQPRLRVL